MIPTDGISTDIFDSFARTCNCRAEMLDILIDESTEQEQWKIDHARAMLAFDVEFLVGECIGLCKSVEHLWDRYQKMAASGLIGDYFSARRGLESALEKSLAICNKIQGDRIAHVEEMGYSIDNADDLAEHRESIDSMLVALDKVWPKIDVEVVAAARKEFEQGKSKSARDILNELRRSSAGANSV